MAEQIKQITVFPGATTAGDSISLPTGIKAKALHGGRIVSLTEGTPSTYSITELTVVHSPPGAGEVYLESENSIQLGNDTTATDSVVLEYIEESWVEEAEEAVEEIGEEVEEEFAKLTGSWTSIISGLLGNIMEWYDFALYGYMVPVLSVLFFPQ